MLVEILSRFWWTILMRGIIWILLGILLLIRPGISIITLTLLFGGFAIVDGVGNVISALGGRRHDSNWWIFLFAGVSGIAVGLLAFLNPGLTALALLFCVAIWAIATGLLEVVAAIRLRREIEGELWMVLSGLISIAFGVLLLARPGAGALTLVWLIAGYAIVFGVILLTLSFRARRLVRATTPS